MERARRSRGRIRTPTVEQQRQSILRAARSHRKRQRQAASGSSAKHQMSPNPARTREPQSFGEELCTSRLDSPRGQPAQQFSRPDVPGASADRLLLAHASPTGRRDEHTAKNAPTVLKSPPKPPAGGTATLADRCRRRVGPRCPRWRRGYPLLDMLHARAAARRARPRMPWLRAGQA